MIAEDVIKFFDNWAPPGTSWDGDNVGLQIGSLKRRVSNIFLCLELTEKALSEALRKKANFIFTHHPFIFKSIKNIDTDSTHKGKLIETLVKNNITLFSAHTNLDFTRDGVSFELAKVIKLDDINFLVNEKANQYKLVVFIPKNSVDIVSNAIFNAGAGTIGEYNNCSFSSNGIGTFKGSDKSTPYIGKKQQLESVDEVRLEAIVDEWKISHVIRALQAVHPYEEPAFDIYPLKNNNANYGFGAIGKLKKSMTPKQFMNHVCNSLKVNNLRYATGKNKNIKTVAVCGGSGSDLLESAIARGADAFVTADLKYHPLQDGEHRILFIDAGHYETEIPVLNMIKRKLEEFINRNGKSVAVFKYSGSTNPVKFFNNKGVK